MRVKLQMLATAICLIGVGIGFACKLWFPQYWTDWYVPVLLVYWLIEMVMSFILERYEGKMGEATLEGKKFMKTYMIAKFVKVFITLALIGIGISVIGNKPGSEYTHESVVFAGSAVVFYLINLAVETYIVTKNKK